MESARNHAEPGHSRQPRFVRGDFFTFPPAKKAGPTPLSSEKPLTGNLDTKSPIAADFATDYAKWVIENPNDAYQRVKNLKLELERTQKDLKEAFSVQNMNAVRPQRSSKMPDVPILTNGKSPTFEEWRLKSMNNFTLNKDHYPTEIYKMAYIHNRCEGAASALLTHRRKCGARNPFNNAEEMIHYLQSVFHDPYRRHIAEEEFQALIMNEDEEFQNFYVKFACLAAEADRPESYLKTELLNKLPHRLQSVVKLLAHDEEITMAKFVDNCRRSATGLLLLQKNTRTRA
ncbi:hypothetical protein N7454_005328 [Penicillium verhagenii]|nr:hypothetical protein N7454_005328 [Penicillium verhagenii]